MLPQLSCCTCDRLPDRPTRLSSYPFTGHCSTIMIVRQCTGILASRFIQNVFTTSSFSSIRSRVDWVARCMRYSVMVQRLRVRLSEGRGGLRVPCCLARPVVCICVVQFSLGIHCRLQRESVEFGFQNRFFFLTFLHCLHFSHF